MSEVKAKVIREVRPREAGMIGHLQGKLVAADALALRQAGELAAAKALIKDLQAEIRKLKAPATE